MAVNHVHTYPQVVGTPSERSDRDLWNHINRYIWGKSGAESSPVGDWSAEPFAIRPLIDINTSQIKENTARFNLVHKNLQALGDKFESAKSHRDSIESKFEKHLVGHNGNGHCEWWDIPCKLGQLSSTLGMVAVAIVGGLVVYTVIIKPKVRRKKK